MRAVPEVEAADACPVTWFVGTTCVLDCDRNEPAVYGGYLVPLAYVRPATGVASKQHRPQAAANAGIVAKEEAIVRVPDLINPNPW
jgi:hypothetical protein